MLLSAESSCFENDKISRKTNAVVTHVSPVTVSHNDRVCSSLVGAQATSCVGGVGERKNICSGSLRLGSQHEGDLFALEGQRVGNSKKDGSGGQGRKGRERGMGICPGVQRIASG